MLPGVKYEQVTDKGLIITTKEEQRQLLEADTVVIAGGTRANTELAKTLGGKVPEVYAVGDSVEPCGICEAIAAGSRVGCSV